ncbi:hypothetical protein [Salibacter halophilus]|uniref:Uncharacterized protein n=1 Tax=Salibacter halophilus TaxID=1803916 RepID=A0A6N6M3C4_9FLAO|nr:hypothetical protein [Salibacter halophilus]KAB1063741.1 hypothetical protein F3059_09235 [Salibacter halophilus]
MKTYFVILIMYFSSLFAFGKCISKDYELLSNSDTISLESKLFFNGYTYPYNSLVEDYPSKSEFVIIGESDTFKLELVSTQKGFNQLQSIFEMPHDISEGEFKIGVIPKDKNIQMALGCIDLKSKNSCKIVGQITILTKTNNCDVLLSEGSGIITYQNTVSQLYGCGNKVYSEYHFAGFDTEKLMFEIELTQKSDTTVKMKAFVLASEDGVLRVGHGMCYGEFEIPLNTKFDIVLRPYYPKCGEYLDEYKSELFIAAHY